MHKCIYWFKFQKYQKNFIMGLKDTVLIYMYPKFHACSINRSISIEFLNKLCSGVKFTFCAHMKQILLSNVLFHCCNIINTNFQYFLLSKDSMHQNKSVIPTKEHSNHYLQNVFISTVTIYILR